MKAADVIYSQKIPKILNGIGGVIVCFLMGWGGRGGAFPADSERKPYFHLSGLNREGGGGAALSPSFPQRREALQNPSQTLNRTGANPVVSRKEAPSRKTAGKTYSWFFDSTVTKQEMALVPTYFRSRIYGSNWGIRFFTFSPDETGYYGSFSVLNQFLKSDFRIKSLYRRSYSRSWKIHLSAEYSNYFHPWYGDGGQGMANILSRESEKNIRKNLYAHRILVNQRFLLRNTILFFMKPECPGFSERKT